jgi:hypothetical protein
MEKGRGGRKLKKNQKLIVALTEQARGEENCKKENIINTTLDNVIFLIPYL